jgi:2OG-Fe(II) oxygenase superfamily
VTVQGRAFAIMSAVGAEGPIAEMATGTASTERLVDYTRLNARLDTGTAEYAHAEPYPHVVLDDFLDLVAARQVMAEFPPIDPSVWINYTHVNERKYGRTDRASFPPTVGRVVDELNSPRFLGWLARLTGISGLLADPTLEGGGLHQSGPGGYLNIHADFTGHPHQPTWRRRVNLLLYLNESWEEAYGGHLELWSRDMTRCVRRVAPVGNRAVIFNTDADAFHGHPEPMTCPAGVTRKSLALYYFTAETERFLVRSTEYRARPGDGLKGVAIYLDKMVLRGYDRTKRLLGLDDRFVSRLLGSLSRLKGE